MKSFLFVVCILGTFASLVLADDLKLSTDSADGNLVPEPALQDYSQATRTPGFSPVYAVVDRDGKSVSR